MPLRLIVWDYVAAVAAYYWLLLPGAITLLEVYNWHSHDRWKLKLPRWARLLIALTMLMVAQFLAYRNALKNLSNVVDDKRGLSVANDALVRRGHELDQQLAIVQQELHDAQLTAGLKQPTVIQQTPEFAAKRRAEAQAELGRLLADGLKLTECYGARDGLIATPAQSQSLKAWEDTTYAALARDVPPRLLPQFGSASISVTAGEEKWLRTLCWATRSKVFDLQQIMAESFSPALTEPELQRRARTRADLGKVLGEGQLLYDEHCAAISGDNPETPTSLNEEITAWEGSALSVVVAGVGTKGVEQWDQAGNSYPGRQKRLQQRCGQLNMRLLALRNILRLSLVSGTE